MCGRAWHRSRPLSCPAHLAQAWGQHSPGIAQDWTSRAAHPTGSQLHQDSHELAGQKFGNSYFCGLFRDKAFKISTAVVSQTDTLMLQ